MKKIILSIAMATALFACQSNTEKASAFDMTAAKAEIAANNQAFSDFVSKGDAAGLASNLYTIDAKLLVPNAPIVVGREAISKVIGGMMSAGIAGVKLTTTEMWGNENTITEEGVNTITLKDGSVEMGKYLVMWKKEDGKWKLHRDCFNSDVAATTK
jgi:ketosteroid isomerase-like protein